MLGTRQPYAALHSPNVAYMDVQPPVSERWLPLEGERKIKGKQKRQRPPFLMVLFYFKEKV